MTKDEIRLAVLRAITESGCLEESEVRGLDDSVRAIGGIEGFDSYSGEEATTALCDFLDYDFPLTVNLFIADSGPRRALRIGEIVDKISQLMTREVART